MRGSSIGASLAVVATAVANAAAVHRRVPRVEVEIRTFQLAPDTARIAAGTVIRWENRDAIEHTVTGTGFDGRLAGPGAVFEHRFSRPGSYPYHCARHRFMTGVVIVTP